MRRMCRQKSDCGGCVGEEREGKIEVEVKGQHRDGEGIIGQRGIRSGCLNATSPKHQTPHKSVKPC